MSARNLDHLAGKRVVFLNWRDPMHPSAGGSEVYCWEIATRWAAVGADVTLLTSAVPGRPARETVAGVRIHRAGGALSLYPRTLLHLARHCRNADIVVDMQNGIPFFAPLVTGPRTAVVQVIHHVHQEQFKTHFPWPQSAVGRFLEGPVTRRVYGRRPVVAVSPSTRSAVRLQLGLSGSIFVVPNGTPGTAVPTVTRSESPQLVAVGRLVAHKRLDLLIQAAAALRERHPGLRLDIVGDGPERAHLTAMITALGLSDVVHLHGRLDEAAKADRFAAAWLHVQPSQGEGWGITVLEAAAHGVPSMAFDVPGLRDAIRHERTGWLVGAGQSLHSGLDKALNTLKDKAAADQMAADCRRWAGSFTWEDSADRLAGVALAEHAYREQGSDRRATDATCVARLGKVSPFHLHLLHRRLRRTDVIINDSQTGQTTLLLYGCDERGAASLLVSVGIREWDSLGPAGTEDLLCGSLRHTDGAHPASHPTVVEPAGSVGSQMVVPCRPVGPSVGRRIAGPGVAPAVHDDHLAAVGGRRRGLRPRVRHGQLGAGQLP